MGVGRAGVLSLSLSADELLGEGGAIRGAFLCCREAGRLRTLMGAKVAEVAEGKRRLGP